MNVSTESGQTQDKFDNAKGGVRLPEMDRPTASYFSPNNQGKRLCDAGNPDIPPFPGCIPIPNPLLELIAGLACRLNGSLEPFDEAMMTSLYKSPAHYRELVAEKAENLMEKRFLLEEDRQKIIDTSELVDFPEK